MRRTFAGLLLLALVLPGRAVAGPPEKASGKMVLDVASTRAKYDRIRVGMADKEVHAIMKGWVTYGIALGATGFSVDWSCSDGASITVFFTPDRKVSKKTYSKGE